MRPIFRSHLSLALLSATCLGAGAFTPPVLAAQAVATPTIGMPFDLATSATATLPLTTVRGNSSIHSIEDSGAVSTSAASSNAEALPDSPSFVLSGDSDDDGQAGNGGLATSNAQIAPKYATTILPGQSAQPLSVGDKVAFALRNTVSPFTFLSIVVSASYSQGVNSAPHYIDNSYPKRIGAAAARNAVQTLAGQAVFAPMFHDDPRYYVLGRQHGIVNRALYAASRVVVTRSDSGNNRLNAPLLLGYAVAAGVNNAYYPQRDRGGKESAISYVTSLGGAALGMEVSEFLNDALVLVHLRHR